MSPRSSLMLLMVVLLILAGATVRAVSPGGSENVYLPTVLNPLPPKPTPTPVPEVCDILQDDFSDPTSGWLILDNDNFATSYDAGEYRILVRGSMGVGIRPPAVGSMGSFSAAVDTRWEAAIGSAYGLYLVSDSPPYLFYHFDIMPITGQYRIERFNDSGAATLVPPTYSPAINPGTATNRVKLVLNAAQVEILVNGASLINFPIENRPVYSVGIRTDTRGPHGTYPAAARFDNFCLGSFNGSSEMNEWQDTSVPHVFTVDSYGVLTVYEEPGE